MYDAPRQAATALIPLDDRLLFEIELLQQGDDPALDEAVDHLVHVEVLRYPSGGAVALRPNQSGVGQRCPVCG